MSTQFRLFIILYLAILNSPFVHLGNWGGVILTFLLSVLIPKKKTDVLGICGNSIKFTSLDLRLFILVYILCVVQALIYFLFFDMEFKYMSRGISTSLTLIIQIYLCYKMFRYFKSEALSVYFDGLVLSYSVNIIYALSVFGFGPVLNAFFSIFSGGIDSTGSETDAILEQSHSILLIMPFISVIYLAYYISVKEKVYLKRMIIAMVISLLAYKRIAIGAACVIFFFCYFRRYYTRKIVVANGVIIICLLMLYVYAIKAGYLFAFTESHNINLQYRDVIWARIDDLYKFDVNFMGHGWDFMTKYLQDHNQVLFGNSLGGIHNDILKIYIDFGFWLTIIYFSIFLIYMPIKLKNKNVSFIFWLGQIYLVIIYLTDNAMIYGACQTIAYLSPFCVNLYNTNLKVK